MRNKINSNQLVSIDLRPWWADQGSPMVDCRKLWLLEKSDFD